MGVERPIDEKKDGSVDSVVVEKEPYEGNELEADVPVVDLRKAALNDDIGDVFDDTRAIDLGADGKERPIGKFHSLYNPLSNIDLSINRD